MLPTQARPRPSPWLVAVALSCAPAGSQEAGPAGSNSSPRSTADTRPIVYECRLPRPQDSGYRFELDGAPVSPEFISLTGDNAPRPGDILRFDPAPMILGPPGHYRYFTDPERPNILELELDGGPRHIVALRVAGPKAHLRGRNGPDGPPTTYEPSDTIEYSLDQLSQLRGLVLETWSDDIAATVAQLDGSQLIIAYATMSPLGETRHLPWLPPALPPDLRALRLEVAAGGSLSLQALPPLPHLRSLDLRMGGWGLARVDTASLARFTALERLALDPPLTLDDPRELRALTNLHVLDLEDLHEIKLIDDLAFVRELPELRRLDISASGVRSLKPLSNHPRLAVVLADTSPVAELPDVPPPALRLLSVISTELSDDAVESFAVAAPQVQIRHRWNQSLAERAACATRIRLRSGGLCHRQPHEEETLFASEVPADVAALLPLLRIDETASGSVCMCCGSTTIEFYRDDELLSAVSMHHGVTIRHPGWPGDGALVDPRGLCGWLAAHGAAHACDE